MKIAIIGAALAMALTASLSSAAEVSAVSSFEYTARSAKIAESRVYRLGVQDVTAFGTFDAQVVHDRVKGNSTGFEIGYDNYVNVGPVRIDGRVGVARNEGLNTASLTITGDLPLGKGLDVYLSGKHVRGVESTAGQYNKVALGLNAQLRGNLYGYAGLTRTYAQADIAKGWTAGLNVKF
jgi:hypothetical protein